MTPGPVPGGYHIPWDAPFILEFLSGCGAGGSGMYESRPKKCLTIPCRRKLARLMTSSSWKQSWADLWNYIESCPYKTLNTWAASWNCATLCIPPYATWPQGLWIIQWPDGTCRGFPLTTTQSVNKLHSFPITSAQWATWTEQWQAQQGAWSLVLQHTQDISAHLITPLTVSPIDHRS